MKIYEAFPHKIDAYHRVKRQDLNDKRSSETLPNRSEEGVTVSSFALQLGKAINSLGTEETPRKEKIEPIKESIERGEYVVDEGKLAEAMIKDAVLKSRIIGE